MIVYGAAFVTAVALFVYACLWIWLTDRQLKRINRTIERCISRDSVERRLRVLSDRIDAIQNPDDEDSDARAG